jgi:hypothetical protein
MARPPDGILAELRRELLDDLCLGPRPGRETKKVESQRFYSRIPIVPLMQPDSYRHTTTSPAAQRIGVNRRGIAPPELAEPEKVDARTVRRSFEPRYSTSAFNALLCGISAGHLVPFALNPTCEFS